jgi:hypothetical protein
VGRIFIASAVLACGSCADEAPGGDGDDSAEEAGGSADATAIDVVADGFLAAVDPNGLRWDEASARCSAEAVVDALGVDRLEEIGFDADAGTPPQLSEPPLAPEEADRVFTSVSECVDLRAQFEDLLAAGGVPPDQASCMADAYLATPFPQASLMSTEHDPDLNEQIDAFLTDAAAQCAQE